MFVSTSCPYRKILCEMATTKTTMTTRAMRPSVRPITASTTSGTTRATRASPSTIPMTMLTSTIAWCTPCVELALRAHSVSHLTGSSPESFHIHPWSSAWRTLLESFLPFYFYLFLLVFSSTSSTRSCTPRSTTRSSWKACATPPARRVRTPTTSPLPSHVMSSTSRPSASSTTHRSPFSFMIPLSDQDMDDETLGKLLTEPRRGQSDYCEPEGMSVSQSSSSVVFDGPGQPDGARKVDQSGKSGVTFNAISAHSNFSDNTRTEKMVDGSGKLDERDSSNAQIRTLLEEQRQTIIAEWSSWTTSSSRRRSAPTLTRTFMATEIGISWSSSTKSYRNGKITKIPKFYLRYDRETKKQSHGVNVQNLIQKIENHPSATSTSKWSSITSTIQPFL